MIVLAVYYDHETETPRTLDVRMTLEEAAMLAMSIGRTSPTERDNALDGFGPVGTEIHQCLSSCMNRHFDGGVDEAYREATR